MGLRDPGSKYGGGEIFWTHPDQPLGPASLLYDRYQLCFPGVKRPAIGADTHTF